MINGYAIIDLQDTNLVTGTGSTITGVYDKIEKSYRKPLLISGLKIDGVEYNSLYASFTSGSNGLEATVYGKTLTISEEDLVTIKA